MEKFALITEHVIEQFDVARKIKGVQVTERDLAKWGIEKAKSLNLSSFKASQSWIARIKKKIRCSSRKITKYYSGKSYLDIVKIQESAEEFVEIAKAEIEKFEPRLIFNTDQSGVNYVPISNRSLSYVGEK